MLRAILALLFAILYLIIGIPVLFVEWIIGKFNRQAADISQLRMVQWAFRVILFICGTRLTIIGEENVPKDQVDRIDIPNATPMIYTFSSQLEITEKEIL